MLDEKRLDEKRLAPFVLSGFMTFVMSNIAREVGRLHDWQGKLWERRYRAIPIADDASLIGRMRYVFENGCKEGLVSHPAKWSGLNAVDALTSGRSIKGIWVNRTALCLARRGAKKDEINEEAFTEHLELKLDPLPLWRDMSERERHQAAAELVAHAASSARREAKESGIIQEKVIHEDPHHRPPKMKKGIAPLCHAASKSVADAFREGYRAFVDAYRAAAKKLAARLPRLGFPTHAQVMAFAVLETG